jgi:hypothetical protein
MAQAHDIVVDEAAWTFIEHDLNHGQCCVKGFQSSLRNAAQAPAATRNG